MTYLDTFIRWSQHQPLTPSDSQYLAADKYTPHIPPPDFISAQDTSTHSIPTSYTKEIVKRVFERSAIAQHARQLHRLDLDKSNPPGAPIDIHFLTGNNYVHELEHNLLEYVIDSAADGIAGIIDQNFWDAQNLSVDMGVFQSDTPMVLFPNGKLDSLVGLQSIVDALTRRYIISHYVGSHCMNSQQSLDGSADSATRNDDIKDDTTINDDIDMPSTEPDQKTESASISSSIYPFAWVMNKRSAVMLNRRIIGADVTPDKLMGYKVILNECIPDGWIVLGVPTDYVFHIDLYMGLSIYADTEDDGWRYVLRLSYAAAPITLESFVLSHINFE